MKKIISIGLIFLMSVQCFYKLGIITYYQLNRDYIAKVLCINKDKPAVKCNGKCFLKRNLDLENEKPNVPGQPAPSVKENIDLPFFLISQSFYSFKNVSARSAINPVDLGSCSAGFLPAPFHPPSAG